MRSKLLLIFSLLFFLSNSLYADAILNINQPIRTLRVTSEQLQVAITLAAEKQKWNVTQIRRGELSATYHKSDYMAKITIKYAPTYYTINYSDSKRMRYTGTTIHPTYTKLIKALQKNIIQNLKSGNFGTPTIRQVASTGPATCQATFEIEGDIWSGHRFIASRHINKISMQQAIKQAESIIKTAGYTISSSNQKHIESSKRQKNGRVYPLSLSFSPSGEDVIGTINSSVPAGVSVDTESVQKKLCKIIDAISNSNSSSPKKNDIQSKLMKIKRLYDGGLITQEEYDIKRKSLLESY